MSDRSERDAVAALKSQANAMVTGRHISDETLKLYRRAISMLEKVKPPTKAITDDMSKIHSNISLVALRLKRPKEALKAAEKAVMSQPDWSKAHARRGQAHEALGELMMAADDYGNAAECCSDDIQTLSYLRMMERVLERAAEKGVASPTKAHGESETARGLKAGTFMDRIVSLHMMPDLMLFLLPSDLARLEQTCRFFGQDSESCEKHRRLARSSPLRVIGDSAADIIERYVGSGLGNPVQALGKLLASLCALEPALCLFDTLRELIEGETRAPVSVIQEFWRSCCKYQRLHEFIAACGTNEENLAALGCLVASENVSLELKKTAVMDAQKRFVREVYADFGGKPNVRALSKPFSYQCSSVWDVQRVDGHRHIHLFQWTVGWP